MLTPFRRRNARTGRCRLPLGAAFLLILFGCGGRGGTPNASSDVVDTPGQETTATILLPVSDVAWHLSEGVPAVTELPHGIRDVVHIVPREAPQDAVDGEVEIRVEQAQPSGNLFGSVIVRWEAKGHQNVASLSWTAALDSRPNCEERIQADEPWHAVTVRGVAGCALAPTLGSGLLEWIENGISFHFESGVLPVLDAAEWLASWVVLE
ncbi:MAG: hypothetical protein R3258_07060 [Acidimicrobiia bacterium]|nr:hypothetical protein [Acidimicrobiia bacterium]